MTTTRSHSSSVMEQLYLITQRHYLGLCLIHCVIFLQEMFRIVYGEVTSVSIIEV